MSSARRNPPSYSVSDEEATIYVSFLKFCNTGGKVAQITIGSDDHDFPLIHVAFILESCAEAVDGICAKTSISVREYMPNIALQATHAFEAR